MDNNILSLEAEVVPTHLNRARKDILAFQELLGLHPQAFYGDTDNCPLKHSFAPGIYVREIFIPAGMMIVGKIHRSQHPNFLMAGEVIVFTEEIGAMRLVAPMSLMSAEGTKRIVYTLQDCWWITIHANPDNTTDLEALEAQIIAASYEEVVCHSSQ